jgi:hypothetical protein
MLVRAIYRHGVPAERNTIRIFPFWALIIKVDLSGKIFIRKTVGRQQKSAAFFPPGSEKKSPLFNQQGTLFYRTILFWAAAPEKAQP